MTTNAQWIARKRRYLFTSFFFFKYLFGFSFNWFHDTNLIHRKNPHCMGFQTLVRKLLKKRRRKNHMMNLCNLVIWILTVRLEMWLNDRAMAFNLFSFKSQSYFSWLNGTGSSCGFLLQIANNAWNSNIIIFLWKWSFDYWKRGYKTAWRKLWIVYCLSLSPDLHSSLWGWRKDLR